MRSLQRRFQRVNVATLFLVLFSKLLFQISENHFLSSLVISCRSIWIHYWFPKLFHYISMHEDVPCGNITLKPAIFSQPPKYM